MLALAAFVGRYSWVYYQEHRPGGDQRPTTAGRGPPGRGLTQSRRRLSTLIQNYPDSSLSELAFFKYGEALFGQGKYPAAISTYRRALAFQEQRVKATEAMDYPDILRRQEAQCRSPAAWARRATTRTRCTNTVNCWSCIATTKSSAS
ncbi:hypothetical protein HS125_13955 [bacterium]|nr:hypothetical protein [bacterium]